MEWTHTFDSMLHRLVPQVDHVYLATNEHLRASAVVETRNARFIKECQARYPLHRYERLAPLMHRLRVTKDEIEVGIIQKACDITEAGFRRLLGFVKPGVGEWEIEAELLHEFVRRGLRRISVTEPTRQNLIGIYVLQERAAEPRVAELIARLSEKAATVLPALG